MDQLKSMEVFRAIVEQGSFVKASGYLGISKPMTSKYLTSLEERLEQKLINRNNHNQPLTEVGEKYYIDCCGILDAIESATHDARQASKIPSGTLRIAAPAWLANQHIVTVIEGFEAKYPNIKLIINLDNGFKDLIGGGYDLALRASQKGLPNNVRAHPIASFELSYVATPTYLKKNGVPKAREDLSNHKGLLPTYANINTPLSKTHCSNNTLMLYEMAMAHMGIAIVPEWISRTAVKEGKLVELFPALDEPLILYATYLHKTFLSEKVRIFLDFIIERTKKRQQEIAELKNSQI